jgi:hypothetical protein
MAVDVANIVVIGDAFDAQRYLYMSIQWRAVYLVSSTRIMFKKKRMCG